MKLEQNYYIFKINLKQYLLDLALSLAKKFEYII